MRQERTLINALRRLGLTSSQAVQFLSHEKIAEKVEAGQPNRFNIRDDIEGGNVIIWLNDLEKDSRYNTWPQGVQNVLPPFIRG
jgi:UDP-glucose:glycoprotein glucosyltransferase